MYRLNLFTSFHGGYNLVRAFSNIMFHSRFRNILSVSQSASVLFFIAGFVYTDIADWVLGSIAS